MKTKLYLVGVVLIAILVIALNPSSALTRPIRTGVRELMLPYQTWITRALRGSGDVLGALTRAKRLAAENDGLQNENKLLRFRVHRLERMGAEYTNLLAQLQIRRRSIYPLEAAEVIAREDSGGWWRTVRINKGRAEGIAPGMAVITMEGLIGQTVEITPHTSEVLLISDGSSKVAVRCLPSGALGIMRGSGSALSGVTALDMFSPLDAFSVEYLPKSASIQPGQEVLTSGLGGVFPPDLMVGRVRSVKMDASGLYWRAAVVPIADLSRLRSVFIVKGQERERTAEGPDDGNSAAPPEGM